VTWTLEVAYDSAAGLQQDWSEELRLGGLFAAIAPPPELEPFGELQLVLLVDGQPPIRAAARLTAGAPASLCVEILDEARPALAEAVARACAPPVADGPRRRRSVRLYNKADKPEGEASSLDKRIAQMSIGEKVQQALRGDREARLLLMHERPGVVQASLVRNPKITLDEIVQLARMPHLAPDAAEAMRDHPSWGLSPQVAIALVRNPRTPITMAIQLVAKIGPAELRQVAKGLGVRTAVAQAARKRLLEGR
jgi:hypothetical protein